MATSAQVQELTSVIRARAHALRSVAFTDLSGYSRARERLRQAFETARTYRQQGQGSVPASVWSSFEDTLRRSIYTFNAEDERRSFGAGYGTFRTSEETLQPESRGFMVFTPEDIEEPPPEQPAAVAPPRRRTTPRQPAAPAVQPSQPAYVAPTTTAPPGKGAPSTAPGMPQPGAPQPGMPPGAPGYQPPQQTGFMAMINPQDRPVYFRPWFIGTGLLAGGIIIYSVAQMGTAKKPAAAAKKAPARKVPKTVVQ